MPKPLRRTTYRDRTPPHNMRPSAATRAEVGLDLESYYQPLIEASASFRGPGIAAGLKVFATVGSEGMLITPGVAFDAEGQAIVVAEGAHVEIGANPDAAGAAPQLVQVTAEGIRLATSGLSGNGLLVIRAWETFDEAAFTDSGVHRMEHTPWIQFVESNEFVEDGMRILLTAVGFGTDAETGKVKFFFPFRRTLVKVDHGLEFRGLTEGEDLSAEDATLARLDGNHLGRGLTLSVPTGADTKAELTIMPDGENPELLSIGGRNPKLAMDFFSIVTAVFAFASRGTDKGSVQFSPDDGTVQFFGEGRGDAQRRMSISPGVINVQQCPELVLEAPVPGGVRINGNLTVDGRAIFRGPKVGFLVDAFRNASDQPLELGDVVVVARAAAAARGEGSIPIANVEIAIGAYDSRACGIVNDPATPGAQGHMVTLGCWGHCKVDADISPIAAGDLLTTSATPGHAQKVTDRAQATGAIIGKALAPLTSGRGLIPVLVSLH